MSRFSGKCDLYDHICMEKMYEVPGGYESDELECFNIFKEKTGGIIYQIIEFKLNPFNIENECYTNELLNRTKHTEIVNDKRYKDGQREKVTYTYTYCGKEFKSLNDINKYGYFKQKEIHFDTIFDIIPYYPYIISIGASDDKHEHITISNRSFVDEEEDRMLEFGYHSNLTTYFRKELQNHYKEVIENYFKDK